MNEQMICFFILGVLPLMSLVIGLVLEIAMARKKRK